MKQPEDTKTIELALSVKRGRGRPAKADALTPAERAKRYRDAKRAAGTPRTPRTEHEAKFELDYTRPTHEDLAIIEEKLATAREREAHLTAALDNANSKVAFHEKDQAMLIAERAAAFKAADMAKAELEKISRTNSKTGELARQILELEATIAELRQANYKLVMERDVAHTKMIQAETTLQHHGEVMATNGMLTIKTASLERQKRLADARVTDFIKQLENCAEIIKKRDASLKILKKENAKLIEDIAIKTEEENKISDASPKKRVRKSGKSTANSEAK